MGICERGRCLTTLVGYVGGYGRERKMFEVFDNLGGVCLWVSDMCVCLCMMREEGV